MQKEMGDIFFFLTTDTTFLEFISTHFISNSRCCLFYLLFSFVLRSVLLPLEVGCQLPTTCTDPFPLGCQSTLSKAQILVTKVGLLMNDIHP